LGYKIGELKIRALRAEAEKTLGDRFDIREFHEVVLRDGAVPLAVLETSVRAWLESQPKPLEDRANTPTGVGAGSDTDGKADSKTGS
jgi:hypothetical protein